MQIKQKQPAFFIKQKMQAAFCILSIHKSIFLLCLFCYGISQHDATREILPTFCKINPLTIYFIPCNKVSNPAYCKQDFLQLCKLSNLIAGYYHKPM
ncbi:hypothetical protein, partial [Kingella kingae]|uniref:hypothetical protein n=1 Tax=Kingella kingae TaxID=504 RepID=UPI001EE193E6